MTRKCGVSYIYRVRSTQLNYYYHTEMNKQLNIYKKKKRKITGLTRIWARDTNQLWAPCVRHLCYIKLVLIIYTKQDSHYFISAMFQATEETRRKRARKSTSLCFCPFRPRKPVRRRQTSSTPAQAESQSIRISRRPTIYDSIVAIAYLVKDGNSQSC